MKHKPLVKTPINIVNFSFIHLTLVMIRGEYTLVMIEGAPPYFYLWKQKKKIMHCVEEKKLSGSFEDKAIFHVILEIDR